MSGSGPSVSISNPNQQSLQRDTQAMMRYDANKKSVGVAYALWFFLGGLGGHRFYLKQTGTAAAMLIITLVSIPLAFLAIGFVGLGAIWIWVIVDAFLIPGITRSYNNQLINNLAM